MKNYLALLLALALTTPALAIDRNVSGQKVTVLAWDSATGRPKTGDSANITAYVQKDDGTVTVLADTSAAEQDATNAKGQYIFDLAQAETNAIKLTFSAKSSTSGVDVYALPAVEYTKPAGMSAATTAFADSSGTTTLLSRLTALRAGYLDYINNADLLSVSTPTIQTVPHFSDSLALVPFSAGSSDDLNVSVSFDSRGCDNVEFFVMHATAGFNSITVAATSGDVITEVDDDSHSSIRQRWYRIIKPQASATYTITVACNGGGLPSIAGVAMKGARLEDISAATPVLLNSGTGTSVQPGSLTPSVDNSLVVTVCGAYAGTITLSGGSGYTTPSTITQDSHHIGIGVAYKAQTTAAAENPTWTIGNGTGHRVARNLAIKPALQTYGTTIDSFADRRVWQREPRVADEWWHKHVTLSGTYVDEQPAFIEVQGTLYTWNDELNAWNAATVDLPWTRMTGTAISSGTWSGVLDVPQRNGFYCFTARGVSADGRVLGTSTTQLCKSGVGIIDAELGQSNMARRFDDIDSPNDVNPLTMQVWQQTWISNSGDGAVAYANALQEKCKCPIALMNYAVSGSGLDYDAGSGKWDSLTGGQPLPVFLSALTFVGGDCEMIGFCQGEADCLNPSFSASGYKAAFGRMYTRIQQATGRNSSNLSIRMGVSGAVNDTDFATDARVSSVRQTQMEIPQEISGAIAGASAADLPINDDYAHFDGPEYVTLGLRDAQCELFRMGLADYSGRGAQSLNAWRRTGSAEINIPIEWLSGGNLGDITDFTGFEVSNNDFSTNLTISSSRVEGRNVVLTLSAAPSGTVKVRYLYGMLPDVDNPVYSSAGDSRYIPLLPRAAMTVETRAALEPTDLAAKGTLPITGSGLDIGWKLVTTDGTLALERTTDGVSVVGDSATETTYSAAVARPDGFESGFFVFDDGLGHEVSEVAITTADIEGGGGGGGGPILQRPTTHVLQVKDRGDGTFGVVGAINVTAGEPKLLWGLEFKGTQLPPGQNLYSMSEPELVGDEADKATIGTDSGETYGECLTQAKFELRVHSDATATVDGAGETLSAPKIKAKIRVTFSAAGDGIDVYVPVNVKAAEE